MKFIPLLFIPIILLFASCSDSKKSSETTTDTVESVLNVSNEENPAKPVKVENEKMVLKAKADKEVIKENESSKSTQIVKEENKTAKTEDQKPKSSKRRSKVSFKETSFNFGHIDQGEVIKHSFVFENTGNADLEIMNVEASCGCTIPTFPFIPIPPGEKGKIDVTYDSKGKLGNQSPSITVMTNARPRKHVLYLKGVVDAERAKPDNEE